MGGPHPPTCPCTSLVPATALSLCHNDSTHTHTPTPPTTLCPWLAMTSLPFTLQIVLRTLSSPRSLTSGTSPSGSCAHAEPSTLFYFHRRPSGLELVLWVCVSLHEEPKQRVHSSLSRYRPQHGRWEPISHKGRTRPAVTLRAHDFATASFHKNIRICLPNDSLVSCARPPHLVAPQQVGPSCYEADGHGCLQTPPGKVSPDGTPGRESPSVTVPSPGQRQM